MAKQIEGQISIFDFEEYLPEGKDKRRAEIKRINEGDRISPAQEYYINTGRTDYWQNEQKVICKKSSECEAYPAGCGGTIEPCRFGGPFKFSKTVCTFSGHSCNKEELWKVAESFDDISCSRTCCRNCKESLCGARCNGSEAPSVTHDWIGDDYFDDIMKAILSKYGALIGDIKNYTFEKSKDYIKPLADTVFKQHREMPFFVGNEMYKLRWPNDGTNGSVLTIKKDNTTVANILTREIIEDIQERYNPKLDIAKAPIYHVSLTAVWNECPNCKNTEHIGDTKVGPTGGYYIDQNKRCPKCGQLFDWSDAAVEAATKYSKEYLAERKKNEDTNKEEAERNDRNDN